MRHFLLLLLVSTSTHAIDFDTEWNKMKQSYTQESTLEKKNCKEDKSCLGYTLSDPKVREQVLKAYENPNTVVYSVTIR